MHREFDAYRILRIDPQAEDLRQDPDYLRWLARHSSGFRFRNEILELPPEEPELHRVAKSVR